MRKVTSQRVQNTVLACVLIATSVACDDSVTGPTVADRVEPYEPSTETPPVSHVTLTASSFSIQAGEIVQVELAIPSGLLETGGKYEVVLKWDASQFEYLYSETNSPTVSVTGIEAGQATIEFSPDSPADSQNRVEIAFAALKDATSHGFRVSSEHLVQ